MNFALVCARKRNVIIDFCLYIYVLSYSIIIIVVCLALLIPRFSSFSVLLVLCLFDTDILGRVISQYFCVYFDCKHLARIFTFQGNGRENR